jgi:hypothetical protein
MKLLFPNTYKNYTKEDVVLLTKKWFDEFHIVPYEVMKDAFSKCLKSSVYPPSMKDITSILIRMNFDPLYSGEKSLNKLTNLIDEYGMKESTYNMMKESFNPVEHKFLTSKTFRVYGARYKDVDVAFYSNLKKEYITEYNQAKEEVEYERIESITKNDMLYLEIEEKKLLE